MYWFGFTPGLHTTLRILTTWLTAEFFYLLFDSYLATGVIVAIILAIIRLCKVSCYWHVGKGTTVDGHTGCYL